MDKIISVVGIGIMGLFIILLIAFVLAFPLMICWNYAMPHVFGLPTISFLHSLCLMVVSGSLIKSSLSASKGN